MSISPPWNPPVIDLTEVTSAAGNGAAVATASGGKVSSAAYPLEIDDSDDEDDHDDGGMALIIHDRERMDNPFTESVMDANPALPIMLRRRRKRRWKQKLSSRTKSPNASRKRQSNDENDNDGGNKHPPGANLNSYLATVSGVAKRMLPSPTSPEIMHVYDVVDMEIHDPPHPWMAPVCQRFKTDPNTRIGNHIGNDNDGTNNKIQHNQLSSEVVFIGMKYDPPSPEMIVLEAFPDIDLEYLKQRLREYGDHVEALMNYLAENNTTYPKTKDRKKAPPSLAIAMDVPRYDFLSSESFIPTEIYKVQATSQLLYDFPLLRKAILDEQLRDAKHHYAIVHDRVWNRLRGNPPDRLEVQHRRVVAATRRNGRASLVVGTAALTQWFKKYGQCGEVPCITDEILREEITFVHSKRDDWLHQTKQQIDRNLHKLQAVRKGLAQECLCCFDTYDPRDMVACKENAHQFCCDCLQRYIEGQMFGSGNLGIDPTTKRPALEIKCFHGVDCRSGFCRSSLEKALPTDLLKKYDAIQFKISVENAGIQNMVACPKCGFQAQLGSNCQKVFECPVVQCRFESCTHCREAAHIPLTCKEYKEQLHKDKGRVAVEEAMTTAKIRTCPKCKKAFVKSDGCNKISCGCGARVCYVCRKEIVDYQHFCQVPHCTHQNCKMCPLWTNAEQDDLRAMREAGIETAQRVFDSASDTQLVDNLLKDPTKT